MTNVTIATQRETLDERVAKTQLQSGTVQFPLNCLSFALYAAGITDQEKYISPDESWKVFDSLGRSEGMQGDIIAFKPKHSNTHKYTHAVVIDQVMGKDVGVYHRKKVNSPVERTRLSDILALDYSPRDYNVIILSGNHTNN